MKQIILTTSLWAALISLSGCHPNKPSDSPALSPLESASTMEWITIDPNGTGFQLAASNRRFLAWGVNYDHDRDNRLLEEYWLNEWETVEADFQEIKALGAKVIRIHLQTGRFIPTPDTPDETQFRQLTRLIQLAEATGLYLDITGLGCYDKPQTPPWYDALDEAGRWATQALFWERVAAVGSSSPAIFCYDLMNEPILPGDKKETDWLAGAFGDRYFVQRIALDRAGRTPEQIAAAWLDTLTAAIRKVDSRHLITVGEIPWALTFPGARSIFHQPQVGKNLDFVSVHFYPKSNQVDKAITALQVYELGKPLVIEEMFPLSCSLDELNQFIDAAAPIADGYLGFYWGKTIEEYSQAQIDIAGAITRDWLKYFQTKSKTISTRTGTKSP